MKMSPREKILMVALIFLIAIAGFYNYIYMPLNSKLDELKINNKILADEIINLKKEQSQKKNLAAEAESLQAEYERLNLVIPVESEMLKASIFIKETAKDCEVNITSLEYEPGTDEEGITAINMKVMLEGRYLPLLAFIKRIENAPRLYLIENLSFSAKANESISLDAGDDTIEETEAANSLPYNPHYFSLDLKLRTYCEKL